MENKIYIGKDRVGNDSWINIDGTRICNYEDCFNQVKKKGYYPKHYNIMRNQLKRKCSFCGIEEGESQIKWNMATQNYYCKKHYLQLFSIGSPTKVCKYDKNEFIIYDNHAEIILYNNRGEECARTIIDTDDVEKCKNYRWGYDGRYAISGYKENEIIYLHKYVMNVFDERMVDHIDKKPLDNRKSNLRIATAQQNSINRSIQSNNTSGVTGVTWDKERGKWKSFLKLNGKSKQLGRFDDFDKAVEIRLKAEMKYFKEYSPNYNHKNKTIELKYISKNDNKHKQMIIDEDGKLTIYKEIN